MNNGRPPDALLIGALNIRPPVVLAPMAGFTDCVFRSLCLRQGCGLVFTELVNAAGIVHGSRPTLELLAVAPGEQPVAAHLYGSDPGVMAEAAHIVEGLKRFASIDINAGCPVRRIVARGAGAGLMADPEKLGRMVREVKQAVTLPVTVKTRAGLTPERRNIFEVARAVEENGAAAIMVHARVASSRHAGAADWDVLAAIKSQVRIPVIGNGGVRSGKDALAMFGQTGVDGVMVGRGALGNPWIFNEIRASLDGAACQAPGPDERRAAILEHLDRLADLKLSLARPKDATREIAEGHAVRQFRPQLLNYLAGSPGWNRVRRQLNDMRTREQVQAAVESVLQTA